MVLIVAREGALLQGAWSRAGIVPEWGGALLQEHLDTLSESQRRGI